MFYSFISVKTIFHQLLIRLDLMNPVKYMLIFLEFGQVQEIFGLLLPKHYSSSKYKLLISVKDSVSI